MGCGKTTVGKLLAQRLDMTFIDMDDEIENSAGKSISRIFEEDGEPDFRQLESQVAKDLCHGTQQIIAAGGGAVLDPANVAVFQKNGTIFCLLASPDIILKRVANEAHRPLLENGDKARKILDLLNSRREIYNALPNGIDTSELSPSAVADRIIKLFSTLKNLRL